MLSQAVLEFLGQEKGNVVVVVDNARSPLYPISKRRPQIPYSRRNNRKAGSRKRSLLRLPKTSRWASAPPPLLQGDELVPASPSSSPLNQQTPSKPVRRSSLNHLKQFVTSTSPVDRKPAPPRRGATRTRSLDDMLHPPGSPRRLRRKGAASEVEADSSASEQFTLSKPIRRESLELKQSESNSGSSSQTAAPQQPQRNTSWDVAELLASLPASAVSKPSQDLSQSLHMSDSKLRMPVRRDSFDYAPRTSSNESYFSTRAETGNRRPQRRPSRDRKESNDGGSTTEPTQKPASTDLLKKPARRSSNESILKLPIRTSSINKLCQAFVKPVRRTSRLTEEERPKVHRTSSYESYADESSSLMKAAESSDDDFALSDGFSTSSSETGDFDDDDGTDSTTSLPTASSSSNMLMLEDMPRPPPPPPPPPIPETPLTSPPPSARASSSPASSSSKTSKFQRVLRHFSLNTDKSTLKEAASQLQAARRDLGPKQPRRGSSNGSRTLQRLGSGLGLIRTRPSDTALDSYHGNEPRRRSQRRWSLTTGAESPDQQPHDDPMRRYEASMDQVATIGTNVKAPHHQRWWTRTRRLSLTT